MTEIEFEELAAGHALGALSAADARAFELALAAHPEWAHHVSEAAETAARLADTVGSQVPPPEVRAALLATISVSTPPPPVRSTRRRLSRGWFALAASVAVIAAVVTGGILVGQQLSRPASIIALEQIERSPDARSANVTLEGGGEAIAHWSVSAAQAVVVVDGLPAPAEGETFELWFVRDGEPIPAGTFTTDASGAATALLVGTQRPGDLIAVTVEAEGGSPTGLPTTDPVFAIAT